MCNPREEAFFNQNISAGLNHIDHGVVSSPIDYRPFLTDVMIGFFIVLVFHSWICFLLYMLYST